LRPHHGITSLEELIHLSGSVAILTIVFSFLLMGNTPHLLDNTGADPFRTDTFLSVLPSTLLIVLLGFVLHELAHKVMAQRYWLWAEYRAQWLPLGGVLLLNLVQRIPIPFVLPGFVQIIGDATTEDNGKISAVGPAMNLAIGYAALPFLIAEAATSGRGADLSRTFAFLLVEVNAFLALFNLLPISVLDGAKVLRWNVGVYVLLVLAAVLLFGLIIQPFEFFRYLR
jgi:Zn-dependent protease